MLLLCKLWPWLAGGLIGWLLSGWLARKLKYGRPPVERIVEKEIKVDRIVDNPEHLGLISKLEGENAQISGLMSQISDFKNRKPEVVEVVKEVDNPQLLSKIKLLQEETATIGGLRSRITELESRQPETVEKEVVKEIDNPEHLRTIGLLETEVAMWKRGPAIDVPAAKAAGIAIKTEDDFGAIEGIGPKINDLIHADGIHTFKELSEVEPARIQKILDNAGSNYQMANPGTWPDQANLACNNRWSALKALQDILDGGIYPDASASGSSKGDDSSAEYLIRINALEAELKSYKTGLEIDIELAKSSGFKIASNGDQDDFTVIEGIGPKIHDLIHAAGIHKYFELARTDVSAIQTILDNAGSSYELARPATWPDQSDLAAKNRWEVLKSWQDVLDGGKE